MACDLTTIQTDACTSGIGKVQDPIQLLQLIAQLVCEAAEGGGGGGSAYVISGVGAPVADPGVTAAIYFDTATGVQYNFYSGSWH
ncbi:MAG: hypothetical protein WC091_25430 [Sulfuricellaceae bacterium]